MMMSLILSLLCFQNRNAPVQEQQRVEYVLLDIAAFNKDGSPVIDLTAKDFVITENRKKVKSNFFKILDYRRDFEIQGRLPVNLQEVMQEAERPTQQVALILDFELLQYEHLIRVFNEVDIRPTAIGYCSTP